ncbi:unnamed protein product [Eruca vesicaria subsp. sativa]|uniref:Response regulatory domain-containing protein n=1 Tax=Eruca vesicaria subsp. sativa TaxID=29727 RepID=A0ABC8KE58_ERUVS|nr:unnamed protein product [Eruca vesicaria subsp. sativa]
MNITVLVVDDDPISLSIISNMLKTPIYIDKPFGEITVMTANDSSEALSKLRCQFNNIDVVITDYHMPGLNGAQLKKRINEEFGNLPVIVMSAEMNNEIEQEALSSGAVCFMSKPIKPNDCNIICQHALNYKINGGSKEIQNTNSTSNPDDGSSGAKATKKSKITWTTSLQSQFDKAIEHIGIHKVTPKKILEFMDLDYLTKAHVASKLQKFRKSMKKDVEKIRTAMISIDPQRSYSHKTSLSKNNLLNSQPGYGLGQSSPMINKNAGFHGFDNYMNSRPTYNLSQTGSNFLLGRGIFALQGEMGSISGTSQESEAHKFGQYGTTSDVLGVNSNITTGTTGSNYLGNRIDEKGNVVGPGNGYIDEVRVHSAGNGSLGGTRVQGNGYSSFDEIRVHGAGNGSLGGTRVQGNGYSSLDEIRVHGAGNGSLGGTRVQGNGYISLDEIRVHGAGNGSLGGTRVQGNGNGFLDEIGVYGNLNGSLDGIQVHGVNDTGNGNGTLDGGIAHGNANCSLGGMRVYGTDSGSLGGIQVHSTGNGNGNGNASLGENLGGMNWNFNNSNINNHGSSTSRLPSALPSFFDNNQPHNYLNNAQIGGVVPVLENPIIFNDHYGINEFYGDPINSQFYHNQQHQGNATGENPEVSTAYPLLDISNRSFNNGNYNEETLNSLAVDSEMYVPTNQDMNITNQKHDVEDSMKLPLLFDQDCDDENFMKFLENVN